MKKLTPSILYVFAGVGLATLLSLIVLLASPSLRHRTAGLLATSVTPTAVRARITHATVQEVLDGATVKLENGQQVRYLGVQTPAIGAPPSTPPAFYGLEAREANRALVEGKQVALEADGTDKDAEGRLLRYVWVDQTFVNVALVRGGYARADVSEPGLKYGALLQSVEEEAQQTQRGIWSQLVITPTPVVLTTRSLPTPAPQPKGSAVPFVCTAAAPSAWPADDAMQHVGARGSIVFQVVRTHNSGQAVFLNAHDPYDGYFYVVIFPDLWDKFPDPPETYFDGRCVVVEGKIGLYRGAPQIIVNDPEQIKIIR